MRYLFLLCLLGCTEQSRQEFFPPVEKRVTQITYVQDPRTNLCFVNNEVSNAEIGSSDVFTNVPCTPEVLKLVGK